MLKWLRKRFKKNEKGQGLVEYGLILALVSVVAIFSLTDVGTTVKDMLTNVMDGSSIVGGGNSGDSVGPINPNKPSVSGDEVHVMVDEEGFIPISSAGELNNIRNNRAQTFGQGTEWEGEYISGLDKKYVQVTDIDLSGIDNFTPLGTSSNTFSGIYEGGGYTINNLTINTAENNVGLFGHSNGGTINGIGLENVDIKGGNYVGGLVGYYLNTSNTGTGNASISYSYVTGKVVGDGQFVGGLVGDQTFNCSILSSFSTSKVSGERSVGGLVGRSGASSIANSYTTGEVIGKYTVGGLVGYHDGRSSVSNSYATGKVTGQSQVGGFIGRIRDNSSTAEVISSAWAYDVNSGLKDVGERTYNAPGTATSLRKSDVDNLIKELPFNHFN